VTDLADRYSSIASTAKDINTLIGATVFIGLAAAVQLHFKWLSES